MTHLPEDRTDGAAPDASSVAPGSNGHHALPGNPAPGALTPCTGDGAPSPAGGTPDSSVPPAGSTGRDAWEKAIAAHNAAKRQQRGRWPRKSAVQPSKPGMVRRRPPGGEAS